MRSGLRLDKFWINIYRDAPRGAIYATVGCLDCVPPKRQQILHYQHGALEHALVYRHIVHQLSEFLVLWRVVFPDLQPTTDCKIIIHPRVIMFDDLKLPIVNDYAVHVGAPLRARVCARRAAKSTMAGTHRAASASMIVSLIKQHVDDLHQSCIMQSHTEESGRSDIHIEYWTEDAAEMMAMTSLTVVRHEPAPGQHPSSLIVVIDDQFGMSEQLARLINTAKAIYIDDQANVALTTALLYALQIWHLSLRDSVPLLTYIQETILGNHTLFDKESGT